MPGVARAGSQVAKPTRTCWGGATAPQTSSAQEFCKLRNTFKMFDSQNLFGTVNLDTFLSVIIKHLCDDASGTEKLRSRALEEEVRTIWQCICGEQESLSYCEFLAMLLPPTEDRAAARNLAKTPCRTCSEEAPEKERERLGPGPAIISSLCECRRHPTAQSRTGTR